MNLFFTTDIEGNMFTLNKEESRHMIRVLRMNAGDLIHFTDGTGYFYRCTIKLADQNACEVEVLEKYPGNDRRNYSLYMAVAPTKNISRFEWFLEKATEIGIDGVTPIICAHSERKEVKKERLNKVITAAVKQSLKSQHPQLEEAVPFKNFIEKPFEGQKFIAYIDEAVNVELLSACHPAKNTLILIGPEGDFSPEEVDFAKTKGFIPVRLGPSRLRTETAAVVACHTVHLINLQTTTQKA